MHTCNIKDKSFITFYYIVLLQIQTEVLNFVTLQEKSTDNKEKSIHNNSRKKKQPNQFKETIKLTVLKTEKKTNIQKKLKYISLFSPGFFLGRNFSFPLHSINILQYSII